MIGNGKGTTEIQVTGDNKVFSIMVTVTSTQNGNNLPLLIDRHNGLLFDDIPEDLIKVPKGSWLCSLKSDLFVSKPCLDAYSLMATQAAKEGILMRITSAYRSYDDQINILATLTKLYGENTVSYTHLKDFDVILNDMTLAREKYGIPFSLFLSLKLFGYSRCV